MTKLLSINADDLGISLGANAAIAHAHAAGVVTAASLMVNLQAFDNAVHVAQQSPGLALGLHYCLTSGRAVSPAHKVPLLVDAQGKFRHSFVGLWRLLGSARRCETLTQMAAELEAQWRRLLASGLIATRIDSHQHVHMLPGLFELVTNFARRERLLLRISYEPRRIKLLLESGLASATGELKRWLLARLLSQSKTYWHGVARNRVCFGIVNSGRMTSRVLQTIASSPPVDASEIIVHPGEASPGELDAMLSAADQRFLASTWRKRELNALLEPAVRKAMQMDRAASTKFADKKCALAG